MTGPTYAHDAHCNVIHTPGPQECPPHCEDEQHITGQPCPSCGSTVTPGGSGRVVVIDRIELDGTDAEGNPRFRIIAGHTETNPEDE